LLRPVIEASLQRLRLPRLDLFFLHFNIVPGGASSPRAGPEAAVPDDPYAVFVDRVRPLFERFVARA